jgi:hypothetical protein
LIANSIIHKGESWLHLSGPGILLLGSFPCR